MKSPFELEFAEGFGGPIFYPILKALQAPLSRISGLSYLKEKYKEVSPETTADEFVKITFRELDIRYSVEGANSLDNIPKTGPAVIVANHPFGGIEGIIMMDLIAKIRPDFKIMANALLSRVSYIKDYFLFVDPFGGKKSFRENVQPLRDAIAYLESGKVLVIFPAGTVSHLHLDRREVSDPPWSDTVSRIIRRAKCPVVPIFFQGHNSIIFQLLGLVHPLLRTALLPRELGNKKGHLIRLKIGKSIAYEKLNSFDNARMVDYLRLRSYILADHNYHDHESRLKRTFRTLITSRRSAAVPVEQYEEVAKEEPGDILTAEIDKLPADQVLFESDGYAVIHARSHQIPHLLREIGRLREITFRDAKEGSGKSIDLDRFDNYYIHLFVWNRAKKELVGGYRLGKSDRILRRFGKKGLYTSTLFDYDSRLLEQISPALELGRSFIRKEYQKSYTPLLMLWKGIGHYVVKNPKYKMLFGPVSINNEYLSLSRQLIMTFLTANNFHTELSRLIRAKNPLRIHPIRGLEPDVASFVVKDLKDVAELLDEIETTQKAVPVLLRQYLKLGGKLLGFNVDPSFGNVLDGLLLVDLTETEPKLRERYLGKKGAYEFMAFHGLSHEATLHERSESAE